MEVLTQSQAAQIVKRLMECIPYSINIMDSSGTIIASGNPARVGQSHCGAKRAIAENAINVIYTDTPREKRGTNEPIVFDGSIIGVVGITGDPAEVSPFTKLVRTIVQLLLEEQRNYINQRKAEQQRGQFLTRLAVVRPPYSPDLAAEALEHFNLDISKPQAGLFFPTRQLRETFSPDAYPFPFHHGQVIFCAGPALTELTRRIVEAGTLPEHCVVSPVEASFADIMQDLWRCYLLGSFFSVPGGLIESKDFSFYSRLLFEPVTPDSELVRACELVSEEGRSTLIAYFMNDLQSALTAEQLIVHRNTLHFRLHKIEDITGRNPQSIQDLLELVHCLFYQFRQGFAGGNQV